MAGLYVHIPFCKSRCIYCGFYSTTLEPLKEAYVEALGKEMRLRTEEQSAEIGTVYLGGGTPSQLSPALLRRLFIYINKVYRISPGAEITIECNPDDVTPAFAEALGQLPVNRVSMGAQTFSDERLRFLHRRHTARQVGKAVERLRRAGIGNISIDLMFGFPGELPAHWQQDIEAALALGVEHISAYSLMYEEGTELYERVISGSEERFSGSGERGAGSEECLSRSGERLSRSEERGAGSEMVPVDEETSRRMYEMLIDRMEEAGFEHYEISNFARRSEQGGSFRSLHNSSYWQGTPYIGLGAAAHSYDVSSRWWNIADVKAYIQHLENGQLPVEERELLDTQTRYNDMVATALRTREGISLQRVERLFGPDYRRYLMENAQKSIAHRLLETTGDRVRLTREGLFVSDDVMSDLVRV